MDPISHTRFLQKVHQNAPISKNFDIIFEGMSVGDVDFTGLYHQCLKESRTSVGGWKVFRRALRAYNLAKYYHYSLGLEGHKVECGVLMGFSALLTSKIHLANDPKYKGDGFHLVDSFQGLSQPVEQDALGFQTTDAGQKLPLYSHEQGHFANNLENVKEVMQDFPDISYHAGWIPEAFSSLPDVKWSYVHIDVDLYEPTYACLEYFIPRMVKGGVIINDDFSSPLFPGGGRGWAQFCEENTLSYVVLDSGQSVYIKT